MGDGNENIDGGQRVCASGKAHTARDEKIYLNYMVCLAGASGKSYPHDQYDSNFCNNWRESD